MKIYTQRNSVRRGGFTLVELIVVLLVLAVLAAILVPSLSGWADRARQRRLVAACRSCVVAAQTLVSENYAITGTFITVPVAGEVEELAEVPAGTVSNISVDLINAGGKHLAPTQVPADPGTNTMQISTLTYTDENDESITYVRTPSPHYANEVREGWVKGEYFYEGEILYEAGFILRCMKSHKSGSRSNTRNPTVKSNKGTWEVIGYTDGMVPYSPTVRYGVGVVTMYNGNYYARTNYNLTGGQTPYSRSSSSYWNLLGPVEPADP